MGKSRQPELVDRREIMRRLLYGAAGTALIDRVAWAQGLAQPTPSVAAAATGTAAAFPVKAKAVIQIWMWGGPSHLDTFDPKPEAGYDYCGPLNKPIETNVKGIRIGELLPLLAQQADKYSLLRGMTHGNNGHETASYLVQTGRPPGERLVYPCAGAVVSQARGYDHGYKGLIPPYIVLTRPQGRFSESGFLGPRYKPFATGGDPAASRFVVEGVISESISDARQQKRRELLHSLDSLGQAMPGEARFDALDACEDKAYDLILGDAGKLFDLSQEAPAMRDKYGRNRFGQSCLMARRLVEAGVPYITVNYDGWDTHKTHFNIMQRKLPEMDKAMSALLVDLSERGLLESTLVWWGGEFGRTPKVQWEAPWNGGRSHFGAAFSALVAGGGFKGGQVLGATNKEGTEVAERPIYPQDLLASIYQQLGLDPDGPLPNSRGLDLKLTLPSKGPGRLRELI
ncbi:MAG: DUF1501 domain-containing protein [Fimbriimonadaceae bacterium]|nr:DUF1501 domain-containing protein [Fimbriimonadaceae bacterium]